MKPMEILLRIIIVLILVLSIVSLISAVSYIRLEKRISQLEDLIVNEHFMEHTLKIEYPKK
jgi:CHASE3 domain sensor protein